MNECMKKIKTKTKAGIATILAVIMVLVVLPWEALLAGASNTGGFELTLNWNNYSAEDGDNSTYRYDSVTAETKTVRLNVKYANKEMTETYEKGTVIITVPGLSGAGRDAEITASSIAADKASSTKKTYAWSYSYNATTDLYTFTNNDTLEKGTNFSGSFELLFTVGSRTSLNDYSKELSANLYSTNNVEVQSNTLTYKQTREKDTYSLQFSTYNRAYQGEGMGSDISDPEDYWWVNYEAISTRTGKAWGLEDSCYEILLPQGAELRYVEGGWSGSDASVRSFTKTGSETIDSRTYDVWRVDASVHSDVYTTYELYYLVIYPKADYGDSATITTYTRLHGSYKGETEEQQLDEQTMQIAVSSYPYPTYTGNVLGGSKTGSGVDSYTEFARRYGTDTYNYGYIDSRHIRNGAREYRFNLYGELVYAKLRDMGYMMYDLEITEDQVEVMMEEDASFRELADDEYTITSMTIPANSSILNQNGNPIDPCEVIIKVRTRGESEYKDYGTYAVQSSSQKISFSEEEEIVGAQISFMALTEGIRVTVPVTMIFHSDDDGIAMNGGTLVNTLLLRGWVYDTSASGISEKVSVEDIFEPEAAEPVDVFIADTVAEPEEGFEEADDGTADSDNIQEEEPAAEEIIEAADMVTDEPLVQELADSGKSLLLDEPYTWPFEQLILERPNFYYNTTTLAAFSDEYLIEQGGLLSSVSLRTTFNYMEEEELTSFSMYTILPEDMSLDNSIRSRQDLYEAVTLSNTIKLADSELEKALDVVTLDTNYQNSGRTMIRLQFTFDKPVVAPYGSITASFPVVAGGHDIFLYGIDATVRGISVVEDEYLVVTPSYGIALNNGRYASGEQELWSGLAADQATSYTISYSESYRTVIGIAIAIQNDITKRVATATEGNVYTIPTKNGDGSYAEDTVPLTEQGTDYSYMLQTTPLTDDGTYATELVLVDALERGALSEWQGILKEVDASAAELALSIENDTDIEATVWYSDQDLSTAMEQSGYQPVLTDASVWTQDSSWTKDLSEVKTVAVSFGDARVENYQQLDVVIHMTAPDDDLYVGEYTENAAGVYYEVVTRNGTPQGSEWISSMEVAAKLTGKLVTLTIEKLDEEDGTSLSGAVFDLYEQSGSTPDTDTRIRSGLTTNAKGQIVVQKFAEGTYYLVETAAPQGYELENDPIILEVEDKADDGMVTIQIENKRKTGVVTLQKKGVLEEADFYSGVALNGVKFDLYKQLGSEPDPVNDTLIRDGLVTGADGATGEITVTDLKWGIYYFVETAAPVGYEEPDQSIFYPFTISAVSGVDEPISITVQNEQIPAAVQLIKYERLENGTRTGDPVAGAFYTLYMDDGSSNGIEIQTVRTNDTGEIDVIDGLPFGSYFFKETVTPNGYYTYGQGDGDDTSGRISFELTAEYTKDNPLIIETYDQRKYGDLWVQKTDDAGNYVTGAEYTLYLLDDTGNYNKYEEDFGYVNPVTTDAEGAIAFDKLIWGDYILKETVAPNGYELDETEYEFEIGPDNVSSTYILQVSDERKTGSVQIIKIKENGDPEVPGDRLSGAVFSLYRNDGTLVSEGHTTDSDGEVLIEDLEWGSYYLEETEAPPGYSLTSTKIRFSINAGNADVMQTLDVENPTQRAQLSLTKRIYLDDWVESHGNPTFIFTAENTAGDTWYKTIVFDENLRTDGTTGSDSNGTYIELTTILADLDAGTYTVTEEDVIRYEPGEIMDVSGKGTPLVSGDRVTIEIDEDNPGTATFVNKKTVQSGGSDTSLINNMVTMGRKLTGISAEYFGGSITTDSSELNRNDLVVTAYYDDGTSRILTNDEYDLWDNISGNILENDEIPDSWGTGSFTINVTYEENGITKKDTFVIEIEGTLPFKWVVNATTETAIITAYTGNQTVVNFPRQVSGKWSGDTWNADGKNYQVTSIRGTSNTAGGSVLGSNYTNITTIILPDTLTSIGTYAFYQCTALNGDLEIPDSVTSIEAMAFYGCSNISGNLEIPDSVMTIGMYAFYNCSGFDGTLTFGSGDGSNSALISIMERAFSGCSKFTGNLVIPDSVVSIGDSAFYRCTSFTGDLNIPDSVTSIGASAFYSCSGFDGTLTFGSGDGSNSALTSIGTSAFSNCGSFIGDLNIPDRVESIGGSAFDGCSGFDGTLTFGSGDGSNSALASIMGFAFRGCSKFTGNLVIPDSVESIGTYAFSRSSFTGTLTFGSGDGSNSALTSIGSYAFNYCTGLTGDLNIPDRVKSIEDSAFYNCTGFNGKLNIPDGVESIEEKAFYACMLFNGDTYIPESVTSIGASAFYNFGRIGGATVYFPKIWENDSNYPFGASKYDTYDPSTL